jgi:hypothetical protein
MKNTKSLLVALILLGNIAVSGIAFAADGVISEDVLSTGSYCHEKFPAIEGKSLASDDPVLKSAQAGDIIDYYGPCDEDLTGKSQVREQTLHYQHHYVTEYLLGGE